MEKLNFKDIPEEKMKIFERYIKEKLVKFDKLEKRYIDWLICYSDDEEILTNCVNALTNEQKIDLVKNIDTRTRPCSRQKIICLLLEPTKKIIKQQEISKQDEKKLLEEKELIKTIMKSQYTQRGTIALLARHPFEDIVVDAMNHKKSDDTMLRKTLLRSRPNSKKIILAIINNKKMSTETLKIFADYKNSRKSEEEVETVRRLAKRKLEMEERYR